MKVRCQGCCYRAVVDVTRLGLARIPAPMACPKRWVRVQDHVAHLLAGREAERHFLDSVSAGAGGNANSDLACATGLAAKAVAAWGLVGDTPVWLGPIDSAREFEIVVHRATEPIQSVLGAAQTRARRLVQQNATRIERLAGALDAAGYLEPDEVARLLHEADVAAVVERPDLGRSANLEPATDATVGPT